MNENIAMLFSLFSLLVIVFIIYLVFFGYSIYRFITWTFGEKKKSFLNYFIGLLYIIGFILNFSYKIEIGFIGFIMIIASVFLFSKTEQKKINKNEINVNLKIDKEIKMQLKEEIKKEMEEEKEAWKYIGGKKENGYSEEYLDLYRKK